MLGGGVARCAGRVGTLAVAKRVYENEMRRRNGDRVTVSDTPVVKRGPPVSRGRLVGGARGKDHSARTFLVYRVVCFSAGPADATSVQTGRTPSGERFSPRTNSRARTTVGRYIRRPVLMRTSRAGLYYTRTVRRRGGRGRETDGRVETARVRILQCLFARARHTRVYTYIPRVHAIR